MAKASFNSQKATTHSSEHISRESEVTYLLEHDQSINDHKIYIKDRSGYLERAKVAAKNKTNRSMQKLAIDNFWQEAVINVTKETKLKDIEKLFKNLNQEFGIGFELAEVAIHRDEGVFIKTDYDVDNLTHDSINLKWFDENNNDVTDAVISYRPGRDIYFNKKNQKWYKEKIFKNEVNLDELQKFYNYHAHAIYTKFEMRQGKNVRLQKSDMSKIQDITAKTLNMQRGQKYSNTKRETHWQRKAKHDQVNDIKKQKLKVQKELQKIKYNYKDLRSQITALSNASIEQKKELHRLNSKIKNTKDKDEKDKLIIELQARLKLLDFREIEKLQNENLKLKKENDELRLDVDEYMKTLEYISNLVGYKGNNLTDLEKIVSKKVTLAENRAKASLGMNKDLNKKAKELQTSDDLIKMLDNIDENKIQDSSTYKSKVIKYRKVK
jgi:hypothetical protein